MFRHQQTQKLTDGILSEAAEDFLFIFFKAIQTNQNLFNFCVQQKQNTKYQIQGFFITCIPQQRY